MASQQMNTDSHDDPLVESNNPATDVATQILDEVKSFGTRLQNIETQVATNSSAIDSINPSAVPRARASSAASRSSRDSIAPSLASLQASPDIQRGSTVA